jgi:predicted dinucleotide-binding enzyme
MSSVVVVIGAGSIGQAIARRVSADPHLIAHDEATSDLKHRCTLHVQSRRPSTRANRNSPGRSPADGTGGRP